MDGDGDIDILYADTSHVAWLNNPGLDNREHEWENIRIAGASDMAVCDVDADGLPDVVATARRHERPILAHWYKRLAKDGREWQAHDIQLRSALPLGLLRPDNFALKGITCGHFRLGAESTDPLDIAITASGSGHGVLVALAPDQARLEHQEPWTLGLLEDHRWFMKYDNILSLDLDNDGDLDLVTTEEQRILLSEGLGVLWYENKPCVE